MKILLVSIVLLISVSSFAQIPNNIPTDSLVSYYPFNGNANDGSLNLNHGIVNGPTLTSDRNGFLNSAYKFNGQGQFIKTTNTLNISGNDPRSISLWFKVNSFGNGWKTLANFGKPCPDQNSSYTLQVDSALNPNHETRVIVKTNGFNDDDYVFPISKQNWYHYVATFKNDTNKIFINGEFSGYRVISINTALSKLWIGFDSTSLSCTSFHQQYNQAFQGEIDDIGIWNRELSKVEISNLYNTTTSSMVNINNQTFDVYPNPVSDQFTIAVNSSLIGQSFDIFDITGRRKIGGKITGLKTEVENIDLESGIYILAIDGQLRKRLVVD